jgi:arginyl-tRNA synthetase
MVSKNDVIIHLMKDIKTKIFEVLKKVENGEGKFLVDVPDKNVTTADFFTNLAFLLAKKNKRNPKDEADIILESLKEDTLFGNLENKNGFINIWVSDSYLRGELKKIINLKSNYFVLGKKKGKIQVEYVSANPTGPLTLANGRGGFFGDVLSNVLELAGWEVEREYYVNDTGNQILTLGKSALAHLGVIPWEDEFYKGEYIKNWAKENEKVILKFKNDPLLVGEKAASYFLKDIKCVLEKKAGIKFDRYTSERSLHKKGWVKKALDILKKSGFVFEKDGALWLKTTAFGDDKDRVLVTQEGKPTYFLADAGHYLETFKRGFKNKINVLGPDHYGYVKRIQAASKIFGFKNSEVLITQAILIKKEGEIVRMSKRKGEFVTFEELVDEVGKDVARFMFLNQALNSHIDFDLELAKERSARNPLFYVEYAYVRAWHILKKANYKETKAVNIKTLNALERKLLFLMVNTLSILNDISKNYEVHKLLKHALDLASSFHNFYEKEKVINDPREKEKLTLLYSFIITMENIFKILGIKPPKKM